MCGAITPRLSEDCQRAHGELRRLRGEYGKALSEVSADEFQEELVGFRARINTVTHAGGLGEIWRSTQG